MPKKIGIPALFRTNPALSAALTASAALVSAAGVVLKRTAGTAVETIAAGIQTRTLVLAAASGVLYLAGSLLLLILRRRLVTRVTVAAYHDIEDKLSHLTLPQDMDPGMIPTLLSRDMPGVTACMERLTTRMLPDCLTWLAACATLGLLSPWLLLTAVCASVGPAWCMGVWSAKLRVHNDAYLRGTDAVNSTELRALSGIETLKARRLEDAAVSEQSMKLTALHGIRRKLSVSESVIAIPSLFFAFAITIVLAAAAGVMYASGMLTAGGALTAVLLTDCIVNPVMSLDNSVRAIRRAQASFQRFNTFFAMPQSDIPAPVPGPAVTFDEVTFAYPDRKPVLNRFTKSFTPGLHAVVGENGSGKSTLMYLVAGVYQPLQGTVTRGCMAVCTQDIVLFHASVRDNLCMGVDIPDERLTEVTRAAGIHDELSVLPDGYDTLLGENGEPLSRGQRQRIAICRTLLRDADVYIFDEPMSALDPAHREKIARLLERLAEHKTVLVVTHEAPEKLNCGVTKMEVYA